MRIIGLIFCFLMILLSVSCRMDNANEYGKPFVYVQNGHFIRDGKPYYFIGTNFWYGAILASDGVGGNKERLVAELDYLKSIGVENLRVLVGADGLDGDSKVFPVLQKYPGVYNDTILAGLDYLMLEMSKRDMQAVLFLNNSWEWSGGYSQYLNWAGYGAVPEPSKDGYDAFCEYVQNFVFSDDAKDLFMNHVKFIVSRTNRYTGVKYIDDPTIFSWQICNEPRAFSVKGKKEFASWITDVAALIRSIDPNHMISSGSEGEMGCENDIELFRTIHSDRNIDYTNIHIWPKNWSWISEETPDSNLIVACKNTKQYLDAHIKISSELEKPLVVEEFGYPRDGFAFSKESSVKERNNYYNYVFDLLESNSREEGMFAGCNFWGWGGLAKLSSTCLKWKLGYDYTGDPTQEPQGLNSVFLTDTSTIVLIKEKIDLLEGK